MRESALRESVDPRPHPFLRDCIHCCAPATLVPKWLLEGDNPCVDFNFIVIFRASARLALLQYRTTSCTRIYRFPSLCGSRCQGSRTFCCTSFLYDRPGMDLQKQPTPSPHDRIIVAGTFDLLHAGHESMLDTAFAHGRHVEIWVVCDEMSAAKGKRLGQRIQPFATRTGLLSAWCDAHGYRGRYSTHELKDAFGDSTVDATYTAIVCSDETRSGCDAINAARRSSGLAPLDVVVAPLVTDAAGVKLSSSALRAASAQRKE